MTWLIRIALTLFTVLALAAPVSAHLGAEATLVVPGDHVNPGETFQVVIADLAAGSDVLLAIARDGESQIVGSAFSDAEGHVTASATLPADYPHGYAELTARARDGTSVSTWILVGPRDASTGAPPQSAPPARGFDPSLLVLGLALGGTVAAVVYALLKRAGPPHTPPAKVRADAGAPTSSRRTERVPRKRS